MKKSGFMIFCFLFLFAVGLAGEKQFEITADTISFSYQGQNGMINIEAFSANYRYSFTMAARGVFSGCFTGNGLGFVNMGNFSGGGIINSSINSRDLKTRTLAGGVEGRVVESLNTSGIPSLLKVKVKISAEEEAIEITQPPPPLPTPIIKSGYLKDEKGKIIGGYFENVGEARFEGKIKFFAGLSYTINWIAESVTHYLRGETPMEIVIEPKQRVIFYFGINPDGGFTFIFPKIMWKGKPLAFVVEPPPPDSDAVTMFKEMIYQWWTAYNDPEPDVDYVNVNIILKSKTADKSLGFYLPLVPYFPPPR